MIAWFSRLLRPQTAAGRIGVSLGAGLGLPVVLYAVLLFRTQGYEPMGLCRPVPNGGHLPIDMSRGSGIPTGCGLQVDFILTDIVLPGLGFALLAWWLLGLLARAER